MFFRSLPLSAQLSGLFEQELKPHVKWCDVRVGARRRCCCEWPLDVTCQRASKTARERERDAGVGLLNNISADSAAASGASIDFLREVGRGGSGKSVKD